MMSHTYTSHQESTAWGYTQDLPTDDEVIECIRSVPCYYFNDLYEVGSGNWTNAVWATMSGGVGSPNQPTTLTSVHLDGSSGNLTLDVVGNCKSMAFANYAATFTLGTQTLNVSGSSGNVWDTTSIGAATVSAASSTINLKGNVGTFSFVGGGMTYGNLTLAGSGSTVTFSGANTFNVFTCNNNAVVFSSQQTATQFNLAGCTAVTGNLSQSTGLVTAPPGCVITNSVASGGATFNAGGCTNGGGNNGWNFNALFEPKQSLLLAGVGR
jgi:hypothetical protein